MSDYEWKISFVLNGAKCEEKVSEGGWSIHQLSSRNGKERLEFAYRFKTAANEDYEKIYCLAQERVNDLLDAMSAGLFFSLEHVYFPTISDFEVVLENKAELVRMGQPIPSRFTINFKYNLVVSNSGLRTALENLQKLASSPNRDTLRHCLRIYRRGLSYEDSFDKFFTLWRTFNALYNHYSTKRSETERIRETLHELGQNERELLIRTYSKVPDNSELAFTLARHNYDLFTYLASKNLVDDYGNDRSNQLSNALASRQSEDIIIGAILCLYVIRCWYAHASDSDITKDEEIFKVGSVFLAAVLSCFLNKMV